LRSHLSYNFRSNFRNSSDFRLSRPRDNVNPAIDWLINHKYHIFMLIQHRKYNFIVRVLGQLVLVSYNCWSLRRSSQNENNSNSIATEAYYVAKLALHVALTIIRLCMASDNSSGNGWRSNLRRAFFRFQALELGTCFHPMYRSRMCVIWL